MDFEIGDLKFKARKIGAIKQFHIVRRISPILADLIPLVGKLKDGSDSIEALGAIMNGISKLSDQDANTVLFGLLSVVEMQQPGGNWAPVANDQMIMFEHLELPVLMQIAGKSFEKNLSGFFSALPQGK